MKRPRAKQHSQKPVWWRTFHRCPIHAFIEPKTFGKAKLDWFKTFLTLENGIPSHDTRGVIFCRAFRWISRHLPVLFAATGAWRTKCIGLWTFVFVKIRAALAPAMPPRSLRRYAGWLSTSSDRRKPKNAESWQATQRKLGRCLFAPIARNLCVCTELVVDMRGGGQYACHQQRCVRPYRGTLRAQARRRVMRLNDFIHHTCISAALFTSLIASAISDNSADRQVLNGIFAQAVNNTQAATREAFESAATGYKTLRFNWTAPVARATQIATSGNDSSFHKSLTSFTGTTITTLTQVTQVNDNTPAANFTAVSGQTKPTVNFML